MDNITLLKKTGLFDGLSDSEFTAILNGCIEQAFPLGTIIIRENDAPKKMLYIVKNGEIVISTSSPTSDEHGTSDDSMITTIGVGDIFGEVSLIDNYPHSATVRAISDATLLLMPAVHFFEVVEKDRNIGYLVMRNLAKVVCQRLRDTNLSIHFGLFTEHQGA